MRAHLEKQRYHVAATDPDDATRTAHDRIVKLTVGVGGTNAYRTSATLPISRPASARRRFRADAVMMMK